MRAGKASLVLSKYALGETQEYPNHSGGDIEEEMGDENIQNLSTACAAKFAEDSTAPPAHPESLGEAMQRNDASHWAKAWDAELERHDTELQTCTYETPPPTDRPLPYAMAFKANTNMYGGLDRHKVRLAISGDRMRPGLDFDKTRTASHLPSQAGRSLLISVGVSEGHVFRSLDVSGAYMRAPRNPNLRIVMAQPPRSNGTKKAPAKVCVLRRATPGTSPPINPGTHGGITG